MSRLAFGALGALFVSILFSSCSADQRAPARLAEGCLINSDCTSPLVCAFQRCHNECTDSRDCNMGQRCVASDRPFKVCELAEEKNCSTNVDCPPGMVCGVDGQCRDQCSSSNDCISGQVCTSGTCADKKELVDGGLPVVKREGGADSTPCVYSTDCPEPLVCKSGMCLIECRADRDCDYLAACIGGRCRLSSLPGNGTGGTSGGGPDGSAGETSGGASGTGATGSGGKSSGGASGAGGAGGTSSGPPGGALTCKNRGTTGATIADTDITTDQTWSGTIHVTRDVSLYGGAILTIKPGTNIVVDGGHSIDFGWDAGTATVMAQGTAAQPITFCGATATPGAWYGLIVEKNVAATSVFANVLVSDSGGTDAGLKLLTNITVNNVQVHDSGTDGVWATDFQAGSTALSVDGSVGAAVVLTGPGAVHHFPLGGALANNGSNVAKLNFDYVDNDTEFHDLGVPYLQSTDVDVESSATVTFDAGIEYRVAATHQLRIGYNSGGSTIAVEGTAAAPVTFRGETAVSGNWNGILIDSSVTSNSHIRYAKILHAGRSTPALNISAPITLDNVSLDKNKAGVQIGDGGLNPDSTMLSITGTADVPLTIQMNAIPTLPTGGSFTGNTTDQIVVQGDTYEVKGTAPNLGIPYFFSSDLDLEASSSLTVAPGVTFIMSASAKLDVGYASMAATFIAKGTAAAPISFVGLDTTSGYWDGIDFEATALSGSVLDHVIVKNAGVAMDGGIRLNKEIAVTNTTVSGSAGYGISSSKTFTTNYAATNTLTGNAQGATGTF
ncbi:MAG TPA: hypothetical protein VH062_32585 [Polyangiaceae bacterium]|jgi:hypothetical protein|nr:hypothetical protein [Polyangiaceae bacterium]